MAGFDRTIETTSQPPRGAARRRLLFASILLLAGMSAALAALELLLRIADPLHYGEQLEREAFGRAVLGQREDGSIRLVPNRVGRLFGHDHAIGDHGFRTPPFERARASDTLRLVVIGDSVAFGWGVAADDAFPRVAERALQARLDAGDGPAGLARVEVLNLSTPGWGVPHYLRCVDEMVVDLDAQLVAITLINNDLTDVLQAIEGTVDPVPAPRALAWSFAAHALGNIVRTWSDSGHAGGGDYARNADFWAGLAPFGKSLAVAEGHLCRAFEQLDQKLDRSTRLVIMDTVTDGAARRLDRFAACVEDRGVARFEAWLPAEDFAERFAVGASDDHPNADGHRILAALLVDWVVAHRPWRDR